MYRKLLGRIYFQYAVIWKRKTKIPVFYTTALFSIINYIQVCAIVLLIDIFSNSNFFESIMVRFKWQAYLIIFFLFYLINHQILRKVITKSGLIQEYEIDKIKERRFLWGAIAYIALSILLFFALAKISYEIRHK